MTKHEERLKEAYAELHATDEPTRCHEFLNRAGVAETSTDALVWYVDREAQQNRLPFLTETVAAELGDLAHQNGVNQRQFEWLVEFVKRGDTVQVERITEAFAQHGESGRSLATAILKNHVGRGFDLTEGMRAHLGEAEAQAGFLGSAKVFGFNPPSIERDTTRQTLGSRLLGALKRGWDYILRNQIHMLRAYTVGPPSSPVHAIGTSGLMLVGLVLGIAGWWVSGSFIFPNNAVDPGAYEPAIELERGHRCAEKRDIGWSHGKTTLCVTADGASTVETSVRWPPKASGGGHLAVHCCVAIHPNSDQELLAPVRRFFAAHTAIGVVVVLVSWFVGAGAGVLLGIALGFGIPGLIIVCVWLGRATTTIVRAGATPRGRQWQVRAGTGPPLICFVTDLHQCRRGEVPCEIEAGYAEVPVGLSLDCDEIEQRIATVCRAALADEPAALLLGGDLTDTGDPLDWMVLSPTLDGVVAEAQARSTRLVAVPGNHDISFNPISTPDLHLVSRTGRVNVFHAMIDERVNRKFGTSLFESDGEPTLAPIPLARAGSSCHVIALNSCMYPSHHAMSNAVGRFGISQLRRLEGVLRKLHGPVILLTHHHVTMHGLGVRELVMSAVDASRFISICERYAAIRGNDILVLHGHRHEIVNTIVRDRVHVYGAPSSTMGVASGNVLDGTRSYARVWHTRDQGWAIERVVLS